MKQYRPFKLGELIEKGDQVKVKSLQSIDEWLDFRAIAYGEVINPEFVEKGEARKLVKLSKNDIIQITNPEHPWYGVILIVGEFEVVGKAVIVPVDSE